MLLRLFSILFPPYPLFNLLIISHHCSESNKINGDNENCIQFIIDTMGILTEQEEKNIIEFVKKLSKVNYIVLKITNRGILLSPVKSMNGLNSLRILFSNVYIINKTSSNEMNKILNKCLFKADCLK